MPVHSCPDSQMHALERVSCTARSLYLDYCAWETVFYETVETGTDDMHVEEGSVSWRPPHLPHSVVNGSLRWCLR